MPQECPKLDWDDLNELEAFDAIMTPIENEQICPECRDRLKHTRRECAFCDNIFDYSDDKRLDGTVVDRKERKVTRRRNIYNLLKQRAREIIIEERAL